MKKNGMNYLKHVEQREMIWQNILTELDVVVTTIKNKSFCMEKSKRVF